MRMNGSFIQSCDVGYLKCYFFPKKCTYYLFIFLFPNWLSHGVYPFRTKGQERRSVSFNLELIKKPGDGAGNAETLRNKEFYKNFQNKIQSDEYKDEARDMIFDYIDANPIKTNIKHLKFICLLLKEQKVAKRLVS